MPAINSWTRIPLKDICVKTTTVNPQNNPDKPFIYVDVSSVSNTSYKITETKTLLGKDAPSRARKQILKDDIIFATVRPTLMRVAIVPTELDGQVCSTGFCIIRVNKQKAEPEFIYYYLLSEEVKTYVGLLQKGAAYPAITDSDIFKQLIPLPSIEEQRAIIKAIKSVKNAKDIRVDEVALYRELRNLITEYLYTQQLNVVNGPSAENSKWQYVELENYLDFKNGINFNKYQKGDKGILTIDVLNMYGEGIYVKLNNLYRVDIQLKPDYLLKKGDILFVRSSLKREGVGWVSLFYGYTEPVTFCGFIIRARIFSDKVLPEFLSYYLRTENARRYILAGSEQVAVTNVNQGRLAKLTFPLPSINEQNKIVKILLLFDKQLELLLTETSRLDELFKTVLEQLYSGSLSAKPLICEGDNK